MTDLDIKFRRIRELITCGCGRLKSDATITRIDRGRAHPKLCRVCYDATPAAKVERAEIAAARKAAERARLVRLEAERTMAARKGRA